MFNAWSRMSYFISDFWPFILVSALGFVIFILIFFFVYKSSISPTKKKLLVAISFFFLIAVFSFTGLEAFFRYKYDQSDGLGFLNTNKKWFERHVVFNTYGFRDRDFATEKKKGVIRIAVLGDSLAMGYGIKNVDDRFSNILEKKLNQNGIKAEVYNLGQSGLDTCGETRQFGLMQFLKFDLVVWEYFLNDVQPCGKSTGEQLLIREGKRENKIIRFLRDESYFFSFVYFRFSQVHNSLYAELRSTDMAQYNNPEIFAEHKYAVSSLSGALKENTTMNKAVVVFFPSLFLLQKDYPAKNIHKKMNKLFREGDLAVIDLLPYLENKDRQLVVNRFDPHPNEYVHNLAADLIYKKVVKIIKEAK